MSARPALRDAALEFARACWPFAVRSLARGRLQAVALDSVAALEAEGFAPAQLAEWAPRCAAGRLRIFGVRDAASGRRVAHFGLRCVVESELWVVERHSIRPSDLRAILGLMADVHVSYQEKTGDKPHAALGAQAAVKSLLVQMDGEDVVRSMDGNASGVVIWQSLPNRD